MARILIVEDRAELAGVLAEHLQEEGHEPRVALDAAGALEVLDGWDPDLVVLDSILPDGAGQELLRKLRCSGFAGPILILSARRNEAAEVRALREGADAPVTEPFGLLELLAGVDDLLLPRGPGEEDDGRAAMRFHRGRVV